MNEPTFNSNGYPSEETLSTISEWGISHYVKWIDFIKSAWDWPDFISIRESQYKKVKGEVLTLSTGGWSGNESIIGAMKINILYHYAFVAEYSGGHYELRPPCCSNIECKECNGTGIVTMSSLYGWK